MHAPEVHAPNELPSSLQRYIDRFIRKLGIRFHGDVLDLGCGDGRLTAQLMGAEANVIAADIAPHESWSGLKRTNLRFETGDAENLRFAAGSFDYVVATNLLHHTASPARAIREMLRVRKPGGRLVIIEPNRCNPIAYVHLTLFGEHDHFLTDRFRELVESIVPVREFRQFECRVWPCGGKLRAALEQVEDALSELPLWRPFILFNVAIA
jgi:ubiquinone/menaquinone biosynthesis C-methylase UbiE